MAARRPRILMVGAHRTKTLGGISTLIDDTLRSPLGAEFDFFHIASQVDESGKLGKIFLALTSLTRFLWALIWWRPQLVYIHVGGNASLYRKVPFVILARLMGQRVLTHFHAGNFEQYYARQGRLGRRLILYGLGHSHRVIAVSQDMGRMLRRLWPEAEVVVVPNGVKTSAFGGKREATGAGVRLLFVGTMGFLKGERDLIRALQRVPGVTGQLRLDLVGRGAEKLKTLCQESGLWPLIDQFGPVPLDKRLAFYRRADLFVLPSYAEGMPMAVLEAMAAGLPVISTTAGGIPELVEDGVEGYLIEPGDVAALADRITLLVNDPARRQRMGRKARAKALHFDSDLVFAQLRVELHEALAMRKARVAGSEEKVSARPRRSEKARAASQGVGRE